ncbi:head-tail connector protein [Pseudorhodoplanes sp.]|uniref:head-tail connector protein n=1 Tax=Pseudorhodoplanes sp. TaxID=1934341 RepID=UPI00391C1753
MSAVLLTPPALEPVSLSDAKHFLRVEHDNDDDLIGSLIVAARMQVELQTRRALIDQTWRLIRDVWPRSGRLPILPVPLKAVTAIRVFDADGTVHALDPEDFDIDFGSAPAVLGFARGAVRAPGKLTAGIEVDIAAGYGAAPDEAPEPLRQAIRMLTAHWYEHRGVIGASGEVAPIPASAAALIAPFRVLSL